jgi:hypothetical protein
LRVFLLRRTLCGRPIKVRKISNDVFCCPFVLFVAKLTYNSPSLEALLVLFFFGVFMHNLDISQVAAVVGGMDKLEFSAGVLLAGAGTCALVSAAYSYNAANALQGLTGGASVFSIGYGVPLAMGAALLVSGALFSADAIVNAA